MMLDSVRGSVRLARNEVRREREKKKHTHCRRPRVTSGFRVERKVTGSAALGVRLPFGIRQGKGEGSRPIAGFYREAPDKEVLRYPYR